MEIRRIKEKSIHDAIQKVRTELGPDAVILSTEKNSHGVEIIAALDFDAAVLENKISQQNIDESKKCVTAFQQSDSDDTSRIEKILDEKMSYQMDVISQALKDLKDLSDQGDDEKYETLNKKIDSLADSLEERYIEQQRARSENFNVLQNQITQLRNDFNDYINSTLPHEMNSIMQIHEEIGDLKDVLGCQTKLLDWEKWGKHNPVGISLISRLVNAGFGVGISKQVMTNINDISDGETAWRNVIELLTSGVKVPDINIQKDGGVLIALGRTGVGKTTTLAKIATKYVIENGPQNVAFINLDNKRVGSFDQLETYGKILNVPVYRAEGEENIRSIIKVIRNKSLVLVDTAGVTEPGEEVEKFLETLKKNRINAHKLLLMSANTQLHNLKQIIEGFKKCKPSGCIITKTDESTQLGNVLTVSIEDNLPVYYETFGQQVPDDISVVEASSLIQRAIDSHKSEEMLFSDDELMIEGINRNGISE